MPAFVAVARTDLMVSPEGLGRHDDAGLSGQ